MEPLQFTGNTSTLCFIFKMVLPVCGRCVDCEVMCVARGGAGLGSLLSQVLSCLSKHWPSQQLGPQLLRKAGDWHPGSR